MKIDAEPVLAHTQYGDQVAGRLPSAAAFNHVLVRATINGETFWLDGTGSGTRLADIRDTPPLGSVLPIRTTGAVLMPIALRANARADMATTLDLDQSAGINLPTPFRVTSVFRGGQADMLRAISAQGSADDVANALDPLAKTYIDGATVVTRAVSFDDAAATATMVATGVAYPGWTKENDRQRIALSALVQGLTFAPDRARQAWRTIPVATGPLTNISLTARIRLPDGGKGFSIEGNPSRTETIAGHNITQTANQSGDTVTITTQRRTSGIEIPFEGLAEARKQFALSTANPIRIVAPATYPPFWQEIEQAKQAHRLDPVRAAYQARIAEKPTEYSRYTDRAWFLDRIYERTAAIADLTKALAIEPSVETYLKRARAYFATGDKAKAMADTKVAYDLDPSSLDVLDALARVKADTGDRAGALALLQERADTGGDGKDNILATIAEVQADGGDKDAAMATIDAAIAQYPGKPALLNSRCWLKGLLNVALDTALRDCTKSIELSESPIAALDSRAMVYFRMDRLDDARIDLDTVLAREPNLSASLFMRGVIRKRAGDAKAGDADLAAARLIEPRVAEKYARYGIKP